MCLSGAWLVAFCMPGESRLLCKHIARLCLGITSFASVCCCLDGSVQFVFSDAQQPHTDRHLFLNGISGRSSFAKCSNCHKAAIGGI